MTTSRIKQCQQQAVRAVEVGKVISVCAAVNTVAEALYRSLPVLVIAIQAVLVKLLSSQSWIGSSAVNSL